MKTKIIDKKLFEIQMLLEECREELKQSNDEYDKSVSKNNSKSNKFVFGEWYEIWWKNNTIYTNDCLSFR